MDEIRSSFMRTIWSEGKFQRNTLLINYSRHAIYFVNSIYVHNKTHIKLIKPCESCLLGWTPLALIKINLFISWANRTRFQRKHFYLSTTECLVCFIVALFSLSSYKQRIFIWYLFCPTLSIILNYQSTGLISLLELW